MKLENSIELSPSMWNVLESQRLRFMEGALAGAPFAQAEQQRPYEVHEKLPALQDPIRGWERQVIVIDNGSTADQAWQHCPQRIPVAQ